MWIVSCERDGKKVYWSKGEWTQEKSAAQRMPKLAALGAALVVFGEVEEVESRLKQYAGTVAGWLGFGQGE